MGRGRKPLALCIIITHKKQKKMNAKERIEIAKQIAEQNKFKKVLKKNIEGDNLNPQYDIVPVKNVIVAMPYGFPYLDLDENGKANLEELAITRGWTLHEFELEHDKKAK